MIQVVYEGPPHPLFGLVSMLEDEDYEVTYDPPELQAQGLVEAELSPTDIQLKGVDGVQRVIQEFKDRHADLPVTIQVGAVAQGERRPATPAPERAAVAEHPDGPLQSHCVQFAVDPYGLSFLIAQPRDSDRDHSQCHECVANHPHDHATQVQIGHE
jgi:hypothetical protein